MSDDLRPDEMLVQRLLEGTLENDEAQALLRFIDAHPETVRNLTRQIDVDSDLREISFTGTVRHAAEESCELDLDWLVQMEKNARSLPVTKPSRAEKTGTATATPADRKKKNLSSIFDRLAALAVLLLLLAAPILYFQLREAPDTQVDSSTLARVEAVVDVVWPKDADRLGDILRVGQQLETSRIRFEKGLLELVLRNHVRIALEGPVDFRLNSVESTFCQFGKLSATVPPEAVGFEVVTPHLTVIDRGTEFFLDVDEYQAEVHTIRGRVDLVRLPQKATQRLDAGEALKYRTDVLPERTAADPEVFLSREIVKRRVTESAARQLEARKTRDSETSDDPSLLVHFDFENVKSTVPNRSISRRDTTGDGVLNGARPGRGRWHGNGAVEFKRKNDQVGLFVPENLESLTLIASVRIDSLARPYQVFLASRGIGLGHLIWQVSRDGSLQLLLLRGPDQPARRFVSPPVLTQNHCGAWYRLAVVLDVEKQSVIHYLDGVAVEVIPYLENIPVRIGHATLGNAFWSDDVASDRSLDGSMEEFRLFNRALTPKEIERLQNPQ